jgi:hypothetical protein
MLFIKSVSRDCRWLIVDSYALLGQRLSEVELPALFEDVPLGVRDGIEDRAVDEFEGHAARFAKAADLHGAMGLPFDQHVFPWHRAASKAFQQTLEFLAMRAARVLPEFLR